MSENNETLVIKPILTIVSSDRRKYAEKSRCQQKTAGSASGYFRPSKDNSSCARFANYKVGDERLCSQHAGARALQYLLRLQSKDTPKIERKKSYGLCPKCGAPGASRERRPNGNDTCESGCVYPSKDSVRTTK